MSEVAWDYEPRLDIEAALEGAGQVLISVHEHYGAPVKDVLANMKSDISQIVDTAGGFNESAADTLALVISASMYSHIIEAVEEARRDIANFYGVDPDELTKDGNLLVIGEDD